MIKQNEVAFIKTSGEAVFVLAFGTTEEWGEGQSIVRVRRPVQGETGVRHEVDEFRVAELETIDEQRARFVAEQQKVMEKYGPKAEQTSDPNNGFLPN